MWLYRIRLLQNLPTPTWIIKFDDRAQFSNFPEKRL
jgi:hypothetical protein